MKSLPPPPKAILLFGTTFALALLFTISVLSHNSTKRALAPAPIKVALATSDQARITWSQQEVRRTLSPSESTSKNLTFTSSLDVQNIIIEAVPEIARFVSIQPNSFATVLANQPQSVQLMFSIPAGTALGIYEATIHVRSDSRTLPQTLKVTLTVTTPEQTITKLADALITGNMDAVLKGFASSSLNREALTALDRNQRNKLATALRGAQFVRIIGELRIYSAPFVESDGTISQVEFSLARDNDGAWIVVNW